MPGAVKEGEWYRVEEDGNFCRAIGSICHADGVQTPSGHCAGSMLIPETVGCTFLL